MPTTPAAKKPSWRHHFVPQFLLRQFADANGAVWTTRRLPTGKLEQKPRSTREIAYQKHLYTVRPKNPFHLPGEPDHFETYLAGIDDDAASVFDELLGKGQLLGPPRRTWARFINALYERSPRLLESRDNAAKVLARASFAELTDPELNPWAALYAEALQHEDMDAGVEALVRREMKAAIEDKETLDYFESMHWATMTLTSFEFDPTVPEDELPREHQFVTSDRPLTVNAGQAWSEGQDYPPNGIFLLMMALSPEQVFVMSQAPLGAMNNAQRELLGQAMGNHNSILFLQRPQFLYSAREIRRKWPIWLKAEQDLHPKA